MVQTTDPKHFRATDTALLVAYTRAILLEGIAAKALAENPCDRQWLTTWEKANRALVALSQRLKLCPQSRLPNRTAERLPARTQPRPWALGEQE